MKKILLLTKYDKLKLWGMIIKSVSGVAGGSLILAEGHPYLTLTILGVGAASNEFVNFLKDKENESTPKDGI